MFKEWKLNIYITSDKTRLIIVDTWDEMERYLEIEIYNYAVAFNKVASLL